MSPPAPSDTALRAEILALRAAGAAFHQIAARLNGRGVKGTHGGRWYAASVRQAVLAQHDQARDQAHDQANGQAHNQPHDQPHPPDSFSGEVHARINATPVAAGLVAD